MKNKLRRRSKISARVQYMSMSILISILVVTVVMATIMITGIADKASKKLVYFYSFESVEKFNSYMIRDLALVQKVAHSKAVEEWFADESDETKKLAAYNEMMDYIDLLALTELYFGINDSLDEFSIAQGALYGDFKPYSKLNRYDPDNLWYYELLDSENEYVFNIDVDKYAMRWRIWINHKVIYNDKIVGVFCSGLSIDDLLHDIFSEYDEKNIKGFVINKEGTVLLDNSFGEDYKIGINKSVKDINGDPAFIEAIDQYLSAIDGHFEKGAEATIKQLSTGSFDYVTIAPIENSDWSVVTFFSNDSLFKVSDLLPLVLTLFSAFIIYTAANTLITRRFVMTPLDNLTHSVSEASGENAEIYGKNRDDEIGELAITIKNMWDRLHAVNLETKNMAVKLELALKEAKEASLAKSNFLANMSHEIRTPINAIVGMASLGKGAADMERTAYCFSRIEDASTHLLGVINDILDVSKIESGKFELSPLEFNFENMLQRVVTVNNYRIDQNKQRLTVYIDKAIPKTLFGDEQRLAQVITNLLSNAVKFTPENGSIDIDTTFVKEEEGICTIQISVADTGIGISPEQQLKLFQSFHQAENNTSRKFGGTGLGLAISKSIIEMMGGAIWIESELGKGATFIFTIQAKRVEQIEQMPFDRSDWKNLRIFAVDDDPVVLEYLREIFEDIGVKCDTAAGARESLRIINQNGDYDIYLIDFKMPDIDGIELARMLREREKNNSDKSVVIMISATDWSMIEEDAKQAGIDKYLQKPLFPSAIIDTINLCIGKEKAEKTEQETVIEKFEGKRILLAEDVEINREIVIELLKPTLLEIDSAENGAQAVKMFLDAPDRYDMIFMDLQMPEMDGYEATQKIRNSGVAEAKTVPIIAMTANVFREDIEKCLQMGLDDHIGKPINLDMLIQILKKYFK